MISGNRISALALAVALASAPAFGKSIVVNAPAHRTAPTMMSDGRGTPPVASFFPFGSRFDGGIRISAGDWNHDGYDDIVVAAGPGGGPNVKVFSGDAATIDKDTGAPGELASFFAYDPRFDGGVFVATGDFDGDGHADIITGAGAGGGPHVKVFDGATGAEVRSFFAFDANFGGGVAVAGGDWNHDGFDDIIVGAGPGGGPQVKVFDGKTLDTLANFFAFAPAFGGGVSVATGRFDGSDALFVGAGAGGGPHVKVFALGSGDLLASFFAFDARFDSGVTLGTGDFEGHDSLFVGQANDGGTVHIYDVSAGRVGQLGSVLDVFLPYGDGFTGGVQALGLSASPPVAGVPEPAVWLQLIAGFGIGGTALRLRRARAA